MLNLMLIETNKLWRLLSVRLSFVLMVVFPLVWAYAPGIIDVYGFYVVSAFQVPALALRSSMEFLMPLLVAMVSASLLGLEFTYGTLAPILLRPVTRSQWLLAKLMVAVSFPFVLLFFTLIISLIIGFPYGYDSFVGGTGLGAGEMVGLGELSAGAALKELLWAYLRAALSLVPVSCLAMLFTVLFHSGVGGALATVALLIVMGLLDVFPSIKDVLLTSNLNFYVRPNAENMRIIMTLMVYAAIASAVAMLRFEKQDV